MNHLVSRIRVTQTRNCWRCSVAVHLVASLVLLVFGVSIGECQDPAPFVVSETVSASAAPNTMEDTDTLKPLLQPPAEGFQQFAQTAPPPVPPVAPGPLLPDPTLSEEEVIDLGAGVGLGGGLNPGGYIDNAQIRNIFRIRYDAGFDLNRPDRAEYFYGSWANLADHPHAIKNTHQVASGVARGPLLIPKSVDYQDISLYLEWACSDRLSVFGELPVRFVKFNGSLQDDSAFETPEFRSAYNQSPTRTQGISDTQLGLKYALVSDPDQTVTTQFRMYIPTGDSSEGLGTGHVSVEPALLIYKRVTEDISFMGQAKLWSPIDGGVNAGNIAIYGAGLSYNIYENDNFRITPVAEVVGWTVLDGYETRSSPSGASVVPNTARVPVDPDVSKLSRPNDPNSPLIFQNQYNNPDPPRPVPLPTDTVNGQSPPNSGGRPAPTSHGVQSSLGETIVNAKLGFRTYFTRQDDVYLGWGHVLTGSHWYQDVFRLEYRRSF